MLDLKSTVLKIKYNNVVYDVRHPSITELKKYESSLKDTKDELGCVLGFLETLGLPKAIGSTMELKHLKTIQKEFAPKK